MMKDEIGPQAELAAVQCSQARAIQVLSIGGSQQC